MKSESRLKKLSVKHLREGLKDKIPFNSWKIDIVMHFDDINLFQF